MKRFSWLLQRLLVRRILGDGEDAASPIPGSFMTLSVSLLIFTLLLQSRPVADVAVLLCFACMAWSGLLTFLESRALEAAAIDRAVLDPLPLPSSLVSAARSVVVLVGLFLDTFNIALPPVILVMFIGGPLLGLKLLLVAMLATLAGMALAQTLRVFLERTIGVRILAEWEGPLRLAVGVALFGLLFAAPDPGAFPESHPWLVDLPPYSLAGLVTGAGGAWMAPLICALASIVLLAASSRIAGRRRDTRTKRERVSGGTAAGRLIRSRFVRQNEQASYDFTLANIARDRGFRAKTYPLFAFPFAVVLLLVSRPDEPFLALMGLYGAAVYLVLAQSFLPFSGSEGGPRLLQSLPLSDPGGYRLGSEKAFLVGLAIPVFVALGVALTVVSLLGHGFSVTLSLAHALLAGLFGVLLSMLFFERQECMPFSEPDRGVYPADLGGGPFMALLLGTVFALVAVKVSAHPLPFALLLLGLLVVIRKTLSWKEKRWQAIR